MDRFKLLRGALATVFAVALNAAGCANDTIELAEGRPACVLILGTYGYYPDGSRLLVSDDDRNMVGSVCTCMTDEEFEGAVYHDELNDDALELCHELSDRLGFAWDECRQNHESGLWRERIQWSGSRPWVTPGLPCR